MSKSSLKIDLISHYGKLCIFGGIINEFNVLTQHHIIAKELGGPTNFKNIVLVGRLEHDIYNLFEQMKLPIVIDLNEHIKNYQKCQNLVSSKMIHEYMMDVLYQVGYEISKRTSQNEKRMVIKKKKIIKSKLVKDEDENLIFHTNYI